MTTTRNYTPYDFRTASPSDEAVGALRHWLSKSSITFRDRWEAVSADLVSLTQNNILTLTFENSLDTIDSPCIGFDIMLGEQKVPTMIYATHKELLAFVGVILGNNLDEETDDSEKSDKKDDSDEQDGTPKANERLLTHVEVSLCRLLFETLCDSIGETWIGTDILDIEVGKFRENPRRSRLIPQTAFVMALEFEIEIESKSLKATWLVPKAQIDPMLLAAANHIDGHEAIDPIDVVHKLPIEVVGVLGNTTMTMQNLSDLTKGDLLLLDQKIDNPILVTVAGRPYYDCWPGKIGNKQGLEIANVLKK